MTNPLDFNNAERQQSFDVIPKKTVVRVRMVIKPGGYDDPEMGLTGGYATYSDNTGSVYFNCEFTVIGGAYNKRKIFSNIGLFSPKGPKWGEMGRSMIRAIVESARGVSSKDESPVAQQARQIKSYGDLDGIEFLAIVGVEKDERSGEDKNIIRGAITLEMKEHAAYLAGDHGGQPSAPAATAPAPAPAWASGQPSAQAATSAEAPISVKPAWAQ